MTETLTQSSTRSRQHSLVDWSAVQTLFESAISDVLLLLDCCAAASSAPKGGTALTETIAACGWESIAAEPGRFSFTSALIEVLEDWVNKTFSVAMLHSKILFVLKHERPELLGGTRRVECRRTPVYIVTTENPEAVSIMLSRMPSETKSNDASISSSPINHPYGFDEASERIQSRAMFSSASTAENAVNTAPPVQVASPPDEYDVDMLHAETPEGRFRLPHVLISVALVENQALDIKACSDWLASFPALARYASVQSAYQGYSTLLIVSLPVFLWNLLPANLACNFIGYVQSTDILAKGPGQEIPSGLSNETLISPSLQHHFSTWQDQQDDHENHGIQTLRRNSRTPSVASTRSMSPTSGNAMRFPAGIPPHFQPGLTMLQKNSSRTSTPNISYGAKPPKPPKPPAVSKLISSQENTQDSGFQMSPPPAKKWRTNAPLAPAEEEQLKAMGDEGNSWADSPDAGDDYSSGPEGPSRKRRRSRKGLDKKFECPQEGCGKSYSRAEHL